jgi:hypothetical protein
MVSGPRRYYYHVIRINTHTHTHTYTWYPSCLLSSLDSLVYLSLLLLLLLLLLPLLLPVTETLGRADQEVEEGPAGARRRGVRGGLVAKRHHRGLGGQGQGRQALALLVTHRRKISSGSSSIGSNRVSTLSLPQACGVKQ